MLVVWDTAGVDVTRSAPLGVVVMTLRPANTPRVSRVSRASLAEYTAHATCKNPSLRRLAVAFFLVCFCLLPFSLPAFFRRSGRLLTHVGDRRAQA